MQMVFQDPISSLNPKRSVQDILLEALAVAGPASLSRQTDRLDAVHNILAEVGLDPVAAASRRPHEFSGGQCQRICIARALILAPRLMICDEPVSALDVSVQAQILNLLQDLKAKYSLSLLFISHDLAVVKHIADRVMVMYLGKVCELAPADDMYRRPQHPYSDLLLQSVAVPDPSVPISPTSIGGDLPSPLNPPSGCRFRTRCPFASAVCAEREPELRETSPGHFVACHHPLDPVRPVGPST
jgi:peptide/nickel transport system ATP-binding protein